MPMKLPTTLRRLESLTNLVNKKLLLEFHEYLKEVDTSENYQNQMLKELVLFAEFLGDKTFYDIHRKEQITAFLDTKIKSIELDPDKKWITTWNDYLWRIKYLFRWLYNYKLVKEKGDEPVSISDWKTPNVAYIKKKKTKRLSPYLESELWEHDELLSIIKYEKQLRNKAIFTLMWDFNARNSEVTALKIKHIRLREHYGEGEVPSESKTGTGPILLRCSFPHVRDLLNVHPYRNNPEARLICNLMNGSPITSDHLCTIFKELKNHITEQIESGGISDTQEVERLKILIRTKKWNPYCLRHSSLTSDSDYLPEYVIKKKARWSMNSRQGARYIKRRMGNEIKNKILIHDGIISEDQTQITPSVRNCPRCKFVNGYDHLYCNSCSYPLTAEAYDKIKGEEERKLREIEEKFQSQIMEMGRRQEARDKKIQDQFNSLINSGILNYVNSTKSMKIPKFSILYPKDKDSNRIVLDYASFENTPDGIKWQEIEESTKPIVLDLNILTNQPKPNPIWKVLEELGLAYGIKIEEKVG